MIRKIKNKSYPMIGYTLDWPPIQTVVTIDLIISLWLLQKQHTHPSFGLGKTD